MKEGKVAQQGKGPGGADRCRIGGSVRQGRAHRGGHQAVDARGTAVGDRAHPVEGQAHPGDIADRRGGADEQRVPVAQGIRQHSGYVQPGEGPIRSGLGDAVAHRLRPQLGHTTADLQPGLRRLTGHAHSARHLVGGQRHVRGLLDLGEHRDGNVFAGQQLGHRAVQGRPAEHDDLLRASGRGILPMGDQARGEHGSSGRMHREVRGGAGGLSQDRQVAELLQLLAGPRPVADRPRDDEGALRRVHRHLTVGQARDLLR